MALVCSPGQVIASFTSADAARGVLGCQNPRPSDTVGAHAAVRRGRNKPRSFRPRRCALQYHAASSADDYQFNRTPGCTNARKTRMLFARGYIISPLRGCCRVTKRCRQFIVDGTPRRGELRMTPVPVAENCYPFLNHAEKFTPDFCEVPK